MAAATDPARRGGDRGPNGSSSRCCSSRPRSGSSRPSGSSSILAVQTLAFFQHVNPIDFLTGTVWSASIQPYQFGVLALVSGTLLVADDRDGRSASRSGLLSAVLLAEYASPRVRNIVKPVLETIAGIPTIVLGFFAINFLSPEVLKPIFGERHRRRSRRWPAASSSGILITPLIASISEDAMRAVPRGLREGAYAMGATRFEVIREVVLPAAHLGDHGLDHPGHEPGRSARRWPSSSRSARTRSCRSTRSRASRR